MNWFSHFKANTFNGTTILPHIGHGNFIMRHLKCQRHLLIAEMANTWSFLDYIIFVYWKKNIKIKNTLFPTTLIPSLQASLHFVLIFGHRCHCQENWCREDCKGGAKREKFPFISQTDHIYWNAKEGFRLLLMIGAIPFYIKCTICKIRLISLKNPNSKEKKSPASENLSAVLFSHYNSRHLFLIASCVKGFDLSPIMNPIDTALLLSFTEQQQEQDFSNLGWRFGTVNWIWALEC